MYSALVKFTLLLITITAIIFLSALLRQWHHNFEAGKLSTALFVEISGSGNNNIIFLHGLTGSHNYWNSLKANLNESYRLITMDLLGFGQSPWPDEPPTLADHLNVISQTIDKILPNERFLLVGHSMGALLALQYAALAPTRVKAIILLSVPVFHSKEDAMDKVGKTSPYMRVMAFSPILAPVLCKIHDAIGPNISRPIFRWLVPDLPAEVVEDATLHTWQGYKGAMYNVILKTNVSEMIPKLSEIPIQIIHGSNDPDAEIADLMQLTHFKNVELKIVSGDHNFVLSNPDVIADKIRALLPTGTQ